jgi:YfiH family protein
MFAFRTRFGPADLAFTDRYGGVSAPPFDELNLGLGSADAPDAVAENHRRVRAEFGPQDTWCDVFQVHGAEVDVVEDRRTSSRPRADALMTGAPGVSLMVRAADCAPVLLVASVEGLVGAAHAGRPGLVAGVVPALVARMRQRGATDLAAWIGPHVCGRCYEVPAEMRDEVTSAVPAAHAETSWGTPAVDLRAGLAAQLAADGVAVTHVEGCTVESADLFSYRRQGDLAGRQAGLVRLWVP